eukprot:TRINITY_DN73_c0_g1_i14.p2 TRINITY_DN73_c0_g1~~TRINITY_DN73_c0_g1_i14.p2  ORF type:complete len:139 (+),score=56.53 TRINITY_DN73_c0_g1_i14:46-417(+)
MLRSLVGSEMCIRDRSNTMPKVYPPKTGLARGPNKGHIVEPLPLHNKPSEKKGKLGAKVSLARSVIREMVGFTPYERRCMDLLNQGFDKRALKFCKKRLGTHSRGKRKRLEMENEIQKQKMKK